MIYFNRRLARNIDVSVIILALALSFIGLAAIASATHFFGVEGYSDTYVKTQFGAIILGLLLVLGVLLADYRWLKDYSSFIYAGTMTLLMVTLVLARTVAGAKSWFHVGPVSFQPSELAKLGVIIVLAAYISEHLDEMKYISGMLKASMVAGGPAILVLAQNDLGTALVFAGILIGMLFVSGGNAKLMISILLIGTVLVMGLALFSMYHEFNFPFLKSYQLKRLQVLFNPYIDQYGHGYNIIQSQIAIGSGQFFGKGLFKGTQNQLSFLPAKHTDFIYSVIGEELGFVGGIAVLILYLFLLLKCVWISLEAREPFGALVVIGIVSMWMFHILENVGMVIGVMPVTGIPLPFISYGGSSMMSNMLAIGVILNVRMRKQKILF